MSKLTTDQVRFNLGKAPGWKLTDDQTALSRTFLFVDFASATHFVSRVAEWVEGTGVLPDVRIHGSTVTITLTSQHVRGLTGKEFALAQIINKI
ncbi:4a-hydroxytetrahydrobiopterin dehydratase [Brevibacillus dissolubilis]|uniref:4a-hydroxytetrahydrobiopterin dehydratase n=1 Tax=Brevibacillus dissolubilis TaxID=1844116 RepID=UPI001115BF03|nr:4a-hydroxytetrahydrobiopterin dehydratase [Brevibacillus dissolubilis]